MLKLDIKYLMKIIIEYISNQCNLHDYKYFSNKIIIDEYIFYNFTKETEKIIV